MFGLPKLGLEMPKGDGSSGKDLDSAMKEVDELSGKLDEAKSQIYALLTAAIPKVDIKLPQLSPSLFSTTCSENDDRMMERAPLLGPDSEILKQAVSTKSAAKKKIAEVQAKADAAQQEIEKARLEMEENTKKVFAEQAITLKRVVPQTLAAGSSLLIAAAIAYFQLGAVFGPFAASISSVIINFVGFAHTWEGRADSVFAILNGVFDRMMNKVLQVLDTVDDMIAAPLQKLESAIDDLCEDQAPTLGKMKKFETALKTVDPDFDLPEPADLKIPLDGCDAMIDDFVDKAKKEIPEKLEEMVCSSFASRIATDRNVFNRFVVVAPLVVIFILDLAIAGLQLMFLIGNLSQSEEVATQTQPRSLRGTSSIGSDTKVFHSQVDYSSCMQPALMQVALSTIQLCVAMIVSRGPRICKAVNSTIVKLQARLNERLNDRIKEAVDRVFAQAFSEVKSKADEFFPKFKNCMQKLKQAIQTTAKIGAVAEDATNAIQRLGF
jgi:flagellar biosynthesis/type III secretory pathway protein FliH